MVAGGQQQPGGVDGDQEAGETEQTHCLGLLVLLQTGSIECTVRRTCHAAHLKVEESTGHAEVGGDGGEGGEQDEASGVPH